MIIFYVLALARLIVYALAVYVVWHFVAKVW